MNVLESWKIATELSVAYFEFADPYAREIFRNSTSESAMETNRRLLIGDLFSQLASQNLVALGFQIEPTPLDGPVVIPAHCFMLRPNYGECDDDIIAASGWKYERVRIARVGASVGNDPYDQVQVDASQPKRGRNSTYPAAQQTLADLCGGDARFITLSAERMIGAFNARYVEMHRIEALPVSPISVRTLRDHLKRFRQQMAENGNINSAN
jgi:hypothetical protein